MSIKKSLLTATILSTAVAIQAWATTTESPTKEQRPPASHAVAEVGAPSVTGISSRAFVGASVNNAEGERIGEVHDLIVGEDQRVTHAVIDVGGFLGLGEKRVLMPFDEVKTDATGEIVVSANRGQLEALPPFTYTTAEDYWIATVQSTEMATPEERRQFVEDTERQLDEWGQKVGQFTENARQNASEASEAASREVSEAWDSVQQQWQKLKEASSDAWESGKSSFEESWNEFERTWNKAENGKS
jgi:sporulation protein YlmC with PRC-barrel domain